MIMLNVPKLSRILERATFYKRRPINVDNISLVSFIYLHLYKMINGKFQENGKSGFHLQISQRNPVVLRLFPHLMFLVVLFCLWPVFA